MDFESVAKLHAVSVFEFGRCDLLEVVVEIDRIVRPGGYLVVQDTVEMMKKLNPILLSLRWSTNVYRGKYLVGLKSSWRP